MGIDLKNKMKNFAIAALLGLVAFSQVESVQCEEHIGHKKRLAILDNLIQIDEADAFGGYSRVVPDRFTEERDDRLMNSVVGKYAREIKVKGALTGVMMLNLGDAQALANEVKNTHKGMGYESQVGMSAADAFNHFDVNHDGLIEAERTPQFLRYLFPNGALDIDLQ